jgi:hypothetical protein
VVLEGKASDLVNDERVQKAYLGKVNPSNPKAAAAGPLRANGG